MSERSSHLRDRLAWRLCDFAMHHLATEWYEERIRAYMEYGIRSMIRDFREDRDPPPSFEVLGVPRPGTWR